jgi:hypothetical protein
MDYTASVQVGEALANFLAHSPDFVFGNKSLSNLVAFSGNNDLFE